MSPHAPKIAALMAYEADALSSEGRRRVEAHLARCGPCREALGAMRVYEGLARDRREAQAPEIEWDGMEAALRGEARRAARRARRRWAPALGWLAVAAAVLLGFAYLRAEPGLEPATARPSEPQGDRDAPAMAASALERTRITGQVVTVVAGATGGTDALDPLVVGRDVTEGMRIRTGDHGLVHARFYEQTGMVVHPASAVTIAELRRGRVVIAIEGGAVDHQVSPLAEGDHFVVRAGGYQVQVRGTRFAVVHDDGGTAVTVDEGTVAVLRDGDLIQLVHAPGTWRSAPAVEPPALGSVSAPAALAEEETRWPVLHVSDVDWVDGWNILGFELPPGEITMRVPAGTHDVAAVGARDQTWTARVVVGEDGHFIEPEAIRPSAPPVRTGHLDPSLIAPVVRRGARGLEQCQRQIDRDTGETVVGRFTLRVTIGRTGEVIDAHLSSRRSPPLPAYRQCVLGQVRNWSFPPPTGGRVTFEQPLHVGTR